EAQARFRVGGERASEDLDRHGAIESHVARAIDFTHAARANRGDDFVRADTRAGLERHVSARLVAYRSDSDGASWKSRYQPLDRCGSRLLLAATHDPGIPRP